MPVCMSMFPMFQDLLIHDWTECVPYIIINRDETDHDNLQQVTLRLFVNLEDVFPPAVAEALGSEP